MKKIYSNACILLGVIVVGQLIGCCSVPQLPINHTALFTQEAGQQYFYCESCNVPTELTMQVYKPLEPDVVLTPIIKPIIPVDEPIKPKYKRSVKPKKKHKARKGTNYHKKPKTKQCIEWRNI